MNKDVIIDKMVSLGLDPSLSGFTYAVDMLEVLPDTTKVVGCMCPAYGEVAKRHSATSARVERAIRHLVERYYLNTSVAHVHYMLGCDAESGKLCNTSFLYKLRRVIMEDTGYFADGTQWALHKAADKWCVRLYIAGGSYTAIIGTHADCAHYIERELKERAV